MATITREAPQPATRPATARSAVAPPPFQPTTQPGAQPPSQGHGPAQPPAPQPATPPIAPERQRAIDEWVDNSSDRSGAGFFSRGTGPDEHVAQALHGQTPLGTLSRDEQAHLLDRAMQRWDAPDHMQPEAPGELAQRVAADPALNGVVGERLAAHAAGLASAPPAPQNAGGDAAQANRMLAGQYGQAAVTALSGPIPPFQPDMRSTPALQQALAAMPPQQAAGLVRCLGGQTGIGPGATLAQGAALGRVLAASQTLPPGSPVASAVVQNTMLTAGAGAYNAVPGFAQAMGGALAREWGTPGQAARISDILQSRQGQTLLAADPQSQIPDGARVNALAVLRTHPEITAATLGQTGDPWMNQAVVGPLAQAQAQPYLARGDAPQTLQGTDLDNTVGTAMGMPAGLPPGTTPEAAEAGAARGQFSYFTQGNVARAVGPVVDALHKVGGASPQVTVLPVTVSSGDTGPVQVPLFRVRDGAGQDRFVDNLGRTYQNLDDWRQNNKLPSGQMDYPAGGHLTADASGRPAMNSGHTPATVDTALKALGKFADTAALVGGVVAGGLAIVATDGLALPAVAAAAGAWGATRGIGDLADRSAHGQSIDPFHNEQARGLWLGLGANVMGVAAFGSAARIAALGEAGEAGTGMSAVEASLHGYTQAGANLANAGVLGDQAAGLATHWNEMSPGDRASAVLQLGFFGATSMSGIGRPGEMFNPVRIRDNLIGAALPKPALDPALPGNQVRIDYRTGSGEVAGIRHGPGATPADIALHVDTATNIQRGLSLEGTLNRLITQRGEPPPGSRGWAARIDLQKVQTRLHGLEAVGRDPAATQAQRDQATADIEADRAHMDQLAAQVGDFARDPGQLGAIDARSTGLKLAQDRGVADLLDGRRGYAWEAGPGNPPTLLIKASNDKLPQLALQDGKIVETRPGVTIVNGAPPINSRFAGEVMPRSELTPTGQKQYALGLKQLPAAMRPAYEAGIHFSREGFPQFPSVATARVPEAAYGDGRAAHFKIANAQVLAGGRKGLMNKGLTGAQADAILASIKRNPSGSPKDWTWHHTERPGELVLVPYNIHNPVKHTGGEALWGGGEE